LKEQYVRGLRLISVKSKIQAIGPLEIPVLIYSFGIINWHQEEIQKLYRETRKMLTICVQHHPTADIDRLFVPRIQEGTGLMRYKEPTQQKL